MISGPSHTAPCWIQSRRTDTCAAGSSAPPKGMRGWSMPVTIRKRRLPSALPGTIAGPPFPPISIAARLRRSSFDICIAAPWHLRQFSERIGRTSRWKETFCCGNAVQTRDSTVARAGTQRAAKLILLTWNPFPGWNRPSNAAPFKVPL